MTKLTAIALAIALVFLVAPAFSKRKNGPWYLLPKAMWPRKIEGKSVNQNIAMVVPNKDHPEEKLLDGDLEFTRKIGGPLGVQLELYQKNCKDDKWLKPDIINASNICQAGVNLDKFWDCFDGELDNSDCSIAAGKYKLSNWSVEEELQAFFQDLEYKCYKIKFCFYDDEEQKLRPADSDELMCAWSFEVNAEIDDKDHKGKRKRKHKKKKKKEEEEEDHGHDEHDEGDDK